MILDRIDADGLGENFDCGDSDLNEYFRYDSAVYRKERLTVSYCFYKKGTVPKDAVAFVDFCNDAIQRENLGNSDKRKIHHLKRGFKNIPAVKITRLGVDVTFQGTGIGSLLLEAVKLFFCQEQKTGCRFLTVDAYRSRVNFYKRNRFKEMLVKEDIPADRDTIPMFFDLKELDA